MRKFWIFLFAVLFMTLSASAEGFVHASGKQIVDTNGEALLLRGYAPGGWMIQESYMMEMSGFATSQHEIKAKILSVLGEENTAEFYRRWLQNGFRREDVKLMAEMGFNSIRLPMHYNLFTLPIEEEPVSGENTWIDTGFEIVDSVLAWCKEYQLYLILDMHGAPGGQGKDSNISDYDSSKPSLWESTANQDKLEALWVKLAEKYANETQVAGYDLINEPNWEMGSLNTQLWNYYRRLINAIRAVDKNHMIILEGNWFCNTYTGLPNINQWDNNLCLQFHKYWSINSTAAIQWMLDLRNSKNVPIWCGESGENSNHWYADAIRLLETNDIGWSWWTWKKIGSANGMNMVKAPSGYKTLKKYWQEGGTKPSQDFATNTMFELADAYLLQNCTINKAVADALLRQPHSAELKPFAENNVPGTVYAADYDMGQNGVAYWDLDGVEDNHINGEFTAWNQGWSYRADGVDIESCSDTRTNGYCVSYTRAGEWTKYTINVEQDGAYSILIRYASTNAQTKLNFEVDGAAVTADVNLTSSGGWTTWKSGRATNVILTKGTHVLKVITKQGGANLNFFTFSYSQEIDKVPFKSISAKTSEDGKTIHLSVNKQVGDAAINAEDFQVTSSSESVAVESVSKNAQSDYILDVRLKSKVYLDNVVKLTYNGTSVKDNKDNALTTFSNLSVNNYAEERKTIPGKINMEDYISQSGLSFEKCEDTDGGETNMGYTDPGDYLDFNVNITQAGTYNLQYRVAAIASGGQFQIQLFDENDKATVVALCNVYATGGWQTWKTQTKTVTLPQGTYRMRIFISKKEFNMNWISLTFPTGVEDMQANMLNAYPNPCDTHVSVNTQGMTGRASVSIYSLAGKEMLSEECTLGGIIDLSVAQLPAATYILSLKADKNLLTQKIIVR